jgi:hypothetical protein
MRRRFVTAFALCFSLAMGVFFIGLYSRYVRTHASSPARLTEMNVQKFNASQLKGKFDAPAAWESMKIDLRSQGASPQAAQKIVESTRQRSTSTVGDFYKVLFRPVFARKGWVNGRPLWIIQLVSSGMLEGLGFCGTGLTDAQMRSMSERCTHRMLLIDARSPHKKVFEVDYVR